MQNCTTVYILVIWGFKKVILFTKFLIKIKSKPQNQIFNKEVEWFIFVIVKLLQTVIKLFKEILKTSVSFEKAFTAKLYNLIQYLFLVMFLDKMKCLIYLRLMKWLF